ncbi:Prefoldin [Xylona heveae TC161]|uniref:Prefoldin n=1 Tax=Xylona heveae (strain CBS 132557 / TC161) TaxID=1328760 RepID=A0A165I8L3_XYLHT|nr:Prefoldin [Xylona heveae TC161]KZF24541.1 Prefoldin [Xylona heveae TC161]
MAEMQKQLQSLTEDYQKLQLELQSTVEARQKLESQLQENKGVQTEFSNLSDDANIYKLVGPVLLKQDKTEAVSAVEGRLSFIEKEIARIEKNLNEAQGKIEEKKIAIIRIQTLYQQQAQQAQAASS